jgi:lysophospholipase L1-like esterase
MARPARYVGTVAAVAAWTLMGLADPAAAPAVADEARPTAPPAPEQRAKDHAEREQRIKARIAAAVQRWQTLGLAPVPVAALAAAQPVPRGGARKAAKAPAAPVVRAAPALAAFHRALTALKRKGPAPRVTVLVLGDSHTAGEALPGYLRERLQRQFGDGGRGTLAAGIPFRYYTPYQVNAWQSAGWATQGPRGGARPVGLSSHAVAGAGAGERMELVAIGERRFDRVEIEFLRGGGTFEVIVDGAKIADVPTRGAGGAPGRFERALPRPAAHLALRLKGDGPVTVLSWTVLKRAGGVVVVSHGVVGETIALAGRWHAGLVAWQMRQLQPALVVLAFGTNEGYQPRFDAAAYGREYAKRLAWLKALAPRASFVLVGPPDAAHLPPWCGEGGERRWRALAADHAAAYARLYDARSPALCYWHAPPALAEVRRVQAELARRHGALFFDWSRVMGGAGGTDRWARAEPPLAAPDRVHFRIEGYDLTAEALYRELLRGYKP